MKQIRIADTTLCREDSVFSFKEKIEIARQLERLNVDVIEIPEIENVKTDILFVRTASSFVKNSVISVAAGIGADSIDNAIAALSVAAKPCIRIEVPISPVGMEYTCHKKPGKLIEWITDSIIKAKQNCPLVEFCAVDASRAEKDFLTQAVTAAVKAGADMVSVCESAAEMLPDDFAKFTADIIAETGVSVGVRCNNSNGLACASAILAVRAGADYVKTTVGGTATPLETFAEIVRNCGNNYGFSCGIRATELHRTINQIEWVTQNAKNQKSAVTVSVMDTDGIHLDANDGIDAVISAVVKLGYALSDEDQTNVFEEFKRVASKKKVGAKELEAIVASTALQVPAAYKLISYVINNGNIISASAQLTLEKDNNIMQGVCIGDGPIDAAFLAIDSIIGHHYELDDFQIQSVTEGKEAMGSAIVKLRSGGKLYSGNGISTDIIGASIRAYINAVNKIVYEEV